MSTLKSILFILVGIVSIGLSISCFNADDGDYVAKNYYGGDAYTGIQHAAAETGENVRTLTKLATKGFGSILLVGGLALVVVGIPSKRNENKPSDENKPNIRSVSPQTEVVEATV